MHSSSINLITAEITNLLLHQLRLAPKTIMYENTTVVHIECISKNAYFMQFFMLSYQIYLHLYSWPQMLREIIGDLPVESNITSLMQIFILVHQPLDF